MNGRRLNMTQRNEREVLLTGNEGISRGFYEAGGLIAASYPGSPTVEILASMKKYSEIYTEFSTNEKVAVEVAMGGSFSGVRSLASMKHVGVNIAADPIMTFTQTPINGGFILVTGDDPGLASSQNEQDNRILGKFANMFILDPADSQEAKDFVKMGLQISEDFLTPCMLRITSRVCHSRTPVLLEDRVEVASKGMIHDPSLYCMIPPNSRTQQTFMHERIEKLANFAYDSPLNVLEETGNADTLIITSGLVYHNVKELGLPVDIWKLGMIYPLSKKRAEEITSRYKKVIVIEENTPFIENELKVMGISCEGKSYFHYTGEVDIHDVEAGLIKAGVIPNNPNVPTVPEVTSRPPLFCAGCPHRPVFDILKKSKVKTIFGDIGCYSMAFLPPFEQSNSIVSMGACVGILKGARKALTLAGSNEPLVAVIGDGTFFHSGIPGFVNLLHNKKDNENMTLIVLDNRTTAMTGGQQSASTGVFLEQAKAAIQAGSEPSRPARIQLPEADLHINIRSLLETLGFDRVREIDQFNYNEAATAIKEEMAYEGLSIIIATRPCALMYKVKETPYRVDPNICIGCKACIRTNCPPLKMKKYDGIDKPKSYIDETACVGCGVCAQVCPVNAIKPIKEGTKNES